MTVTRIPGTGISPVTVDGDTIRVRDMTVTHPEATAFLRAQLEEHGMEGMTELVRRALPVGLVALSMGTAAVDTGAMARTLDAFAEQVDAKSKSALAGLEQAVSRLEAGEETVRKAASTVLTNLPAQLEAALAGEAANVRAAVLEATRAVQTNGMQELTAALAAHSASVRDALSLDREGPVRMLRQDLLTELAGARKELVEQLTVVRTLVESARVQKEAGAKSSRAVGAEWEEHALDIANDVVTSAGDRFEATGGQVGVGGTTRRTGDGVATLSPAITGHGRQVRIVLECKKRSRPLGVKAHRDEMTRARQVRDASAGLVLVPTREEVPGGGLFARVDDFAFVVAAEDPEMVSLIYLLVREMVAVMTIRQGDDSEIDLAQIEARLNLALSTMDEFDEVGRLAVQAQRAMEKLTTVGRAAQQKARTALIECVSLLHS